MGWYYIVTEEMLALGLKGSELDIFAIIHGFSQKQGGCYYGGNVLLAEMTGMTEKSVRQILHRMLEKGLLKREPIRRNGKDMFAYSTGEKYSGVTGAFSSGVRGKKFPNTGEKISPNNKDITETMSPKSKKENTSTTFTPPTVEEVYQYVKDKGMRDPEGFAQYYVEEQTDQGWTRKDGGKKVPVRDWKGNVRQWMPNHMTHIFPKQAAEPKKPMTVDEYFKTR